MQKQYWPWFIFMCVYMRPGIQGLRKFRRLPTPFNPSGSEAGKYSRKTTHDDVIKRKHFPRYWPFVRGIHRSLVNSPHKGQWRGALMFSLICVGINSWVNSREAGDLIRYSTHYDVTVMVSTTAADTLDPCLTRSQTTRICFHHLAHTTYCDEP